MSLIKPERFEQGEPFTVRLHGILDDYPPGASILKELLQNADDAKAKVIRYTLDTSSYPAENLVDMGLADSQGPALLVFNDAIFTEDDYNSLKRLGDSSKMQDRSATGKFGLGFNSVYGWTDTPSILSGKYFTAFSPHERLINGGRGLRFDFVSHPSQILFKDQLMAFSRITTNLDKQFNGTIIRLPFRTKNQAKISQINNLAITTSDVLQYFEVFQTDVAESLVFLKNIECVEFFVDDHKLGSTIILNPENIRPTRKSVASAISNNRAASLGARFEILQEYASPRFNRRVQVYHVQQATFDVETLEMSPELRQWAAKEKAVPWVSLATRLDSTESPDLIGSPISRVFVSLPLPIHLDNTRVNIHGMFSIKRDRRSLWTDNDSSGPYKMKEVLWNNLLIRDLLPIVWHELLVRLTKSKSSVYDYFPLMPTSVGSSFNHLAVDVVKEIVRTNGVIWRSITDQYLPLKNGFLVASEYLEDPLLSCFKDLSMPIFNKVPRAIVQMIQNSQCSHNILNESVARTWLRQKFRLSGVQLHDISTAMEILEYLSRDEQLAQLYDLPIFASIDGHLRSLNKVPRSESITLPFNSRFYIGTADESALFDPSGQLFLDLKKYPVKVSSRIRRHIAAMSSMLNLELFGIEAFGRYLRDVLFPKPGIFRPSEDVIELSKCGVDLEWIQRLWCWLDKIPIADVGKAVHLRWLIPLEGGKTLRKACPSNPTLTVDGEGGELIAEIYKACDGRFPLVERGFQAPLNGYLRATRQIVDATDLAALLTWVTPNTIANTNALFRDRFRNHLRFAIRRQGDSIDPHHITLLSKLPIFKTLVPFERESAPFYSISYYTLSQDRSYAVSRVPCVPMVPNFEFVDASDDNDKELLKLIGYPLLSTLELLTDFVIPNLKSQPQWLIDPLIELVFRHVPLAGKDDLILCMADVSFVAVCDRNGRVSDRRLNPSRVINKTSQIANLYFDDEPVFGIGMYSAESVYFQNLLLLGMKRDIDEDIIAERIKFYHSRDHNDPEMFEKYKELLELLNISRSKFAFKDEWLALMKLPIVRMGERMIVHPSQARHNSLAPLVEGVLGIVPFHVEEFLKKAFGWDSDIPPDIISSRIDIIADFASSLTAQDALYPVLVYLNAIASRTDLKIDEYVAIINTRLGAKPWLPGSRQGLWSPDRVFFEGARQFEPYFSDLPAMWSTNLSGILKRFEVELTPGPEKLVEYLSTLDSTDSLPSQTMETVIMALERLENSEIEASLLAKLRIPDVHGVLLPIDVFTSKYSNSKIDNGVHYAHPRVPSYLAFKYSIPRFENDLAHFHYLNGPDCFDEYAQEESIVKRIESQVKESTLWLSFNEFIANAEDCGSASEVTWVLDSEMSNYPSRHLFCQELQEWQGLSLYTYNDGVFRESDFEALVSIGMGSKSGDSSKIGKHGFGSLTMYLFTDVPSIISGEYFIMFDPSRRYLPFDQSRRRRKAGLRLKLTQMQANFVDHLAPFVGIGGYTIDQDNFPGTIFRFPIRNNRQREQSPFNRPSSSHSYESIKKYLDAAYLDQAGRSLVLLKNIHRIGYRVKNSNYTMSGSSLIYHNSDEQWRVASAVDNGKVHHEQDGDCFRNIESSTLNVTINNKGSSPQLSKWVIVKAFILNERVIPQTLRQFATEERLVASANRPDRHSVSDIAVGAPISGMKKTLYYNSLPLDIEFGLPVNFHGRFSMSPDRRSLRTDSKGGEWNKFLVQFCLPKIYYIFLERLVSWHGSSIDSYKLWPSLATRDGNTEKARVKFWNEIRTVPRKLFLDTMQPGLPVAVSDVIFDQRPDASNHRILPSLIKRIQPSIAIVNNPLILDGVFPPTRQLPIGTPAVKSLTYKYIQELLRENSSKEKMNALAFSDAELKFLVEAIVGTQSLKDLEGCRILPLDNGQLWKVEHSSSSQCLPVSPKACYFIDTAGFELFKNISGGCLISPTVLDWEFANRLSVVPGLNVQRFGGSVVDRFLKKSTKSDMIKTFSDTESQWVRSVYKYVVSRSLEVESFQTLPMIPLLQRNTYISLKAWVHLPIMPPIQRPEMQRVCERLQGLHMLENLNFGPMKTLVTVSDLEQLLHCLHRLCQWNHKKVEVLCREYLYAEDLQYLNERYVEFSINRILNNEQIHILQYMPLWTVRGTSGSASERIAAVNALLLPDDNLLPSDDQPSGPYVVGLSEPARNLIIALGGKQIDTEKYVSEKVLPFILRRLQLFYGKRNRNEKLRSEFKPRRPEGIDEPASPAVMPDSSQPEFAEPLPQTPTSAVEAGMMQTPTLAASIRSESRSGDPEPCVVALERAPKRRVTGFRRPKKEQHTKRDPPEDLALNPFVFLNRLFDFISKTPSLLCSPLTKGPLVPDRNGELRRAAELYNPSEPVFLASFGHDSSKFPHESVNFLSLEKLGFNLKVTKPSFKACVRSLNEEYQTNGPSISLHNRSSTIWKALNSGPGVQKYHQSWTSEELEGLSKYHFVPVHRFVSGIESYRDGKLQQQRNVTLATMNKVMLTPDTSICWTQKYMPTTPPESWLIALFSFSPSLDEVVKHLVDMATVVASKCNITEAEFFQDLRLTYEYLSDYTRIHNAGVILRHRFPDKAVWVNEDTPIEIIARGKTLSSCGLLRQTTASTADTLSWRLGKSIVVGISYDSPSSGIYFMRQGMLKYKELLLASGSHVVKSHVTEPVPEPRTNHNDAILKSLREMRQSGSLCDMTIIVDGRRFPAHRAVLATFSSFFRAMCTNERWQECSTGILNLDDLVDSSMPPTNEGGQTNYATHNSVAMALDWIYNGEIAIDDSGLEDDAITNRLDLYLDILQLADVWDLPTLKTHVENRILKKTVAFIRVENVQMVCEYVARFNGKCVEKHCREFIAKNKEIVELIGATTANTREPISAERTGRRGGLLRLLHGARSIRYLRDTIRSL